MATAHTLTAQDQWFLKKGLCDPVTKVPFAEGDTVVICADCKVPHDVSTWGLDAERNCACCQRNNLMEFEQFSPKILRPKVIRTAKFRIIDIDGEEEAPLLEKLGRIQAYPWVYAAVILLPLLAAVLLFYSAHAQGIQLFSVLRYMVSGIKGRLEQLIALAGRDLSQTAGSLVREKIPTLERTLLEGAGYAGTKLQRIPYRLLVALAGLRAIPSKLGSLTWKFAPFSDRVKLKLGYVFRRIVGWLRLGSS